MKESFLRPTRWIAMLAIVAGLFAFPTGVEASTFVVNTVNDLDDGVCDSTHCSLREAMYAANSNPGPDEIHFNIPGPGPHTIKLCSLLPIISDDATTIDGTTEPDYAGTPVVTLTPSADPSCSNPHIGIWIRSSGNVIRALHFIDFMQPNIQGESGILIDAGSDNLIERNSIGYQPACTIVNIERGIKIELDAGNQNILRNIIACNSIGIDVWVGSHLIKNNYIGVDPSGATAANNATGIFIYETAHGSSILENLISGNITAMVVNSDHNLIQGNRVGTDWAGTNAIPNLGGMSVNGDYNRIGGPNPGEGNLISANQYTGLDLYCGAQFNQVFGNVIGADYTGTIPMGNFDGVTIVGNTNTIGGTNPGEANRILFNLNTGISLFALAQKNRLLGNEIAYSHAQGVFLTSSMGFPVSNQISHNSIHHNRALGIDLEPVWVTPNDPGDADMGPNTLLNFPVLSSASLTTAEGQACPGCTVEVFIADSGASAYGEGMTFIGEGNADAAGQFSVALSGVSFCDPITATATDGSLNTSEFSKNMLASCLILIHPWPYLIFVGLALFGASAGGAAGRAGGHTPLGLAFAGLILGSVLGGGLLILGAAMPNVHLELQPRSGQEETIPPCSQYLEPKGYTPPAGEVFKVEQDPLLSWMPVSDMPVETPNWRIELRTPDGVFSQTTRETSLLFSSFGFVPRTGDLLYWRVIGEPESGALPGFCSPSAWMPFSFEIPDGEDTPEETAPSSPTPTSTPTPTTTPTPTPSVCMYTALQNANCRASDYVESAQIAIMLKGDSAELIALNPEFTHGKFELPSQQQCWIWLGLLDGPPNPFGTCSVPVVDPPPRPTDTPTPPACRPDMDQEACEASGGTWTGGVVGRTGCTCPE